MCDLYIILKVRMRVFEPYNPSFNNFGHVIHDPEQCKREYEEYVCKDWEEHLCYKVKE